MERVELAVIPGPSASHLAPMVEFGKVLVARDHRISVTVFIMSLPFLSKLNSYAQTLLSTQPPPRMRFIDLPLDEATSEHIKSIPWAYFLTELLEIHKPRVRDFLSSESTPRLSGLLLDMFCTPFMDMAAEFGVPSYVFLTSGASFLSLIFYLQSLQDDQNRDVTEFKDSDAELPIPGFVNPVPAKVLPYVVFDKETGWASLMMDIARRFRKMKGILVNSFTELEPHLIKCILDDPMIPPVHAVGPILKLSNNDQNNLDQYDAIMAWLDNQPSTSVIFLCFGSMGTFEVEQLAELARALEYSGYRFLWSLQPPPPKKKIELPTDYDNLNDVLPGGFLDRTKEIGKVLGWAPQVAVLSHPAVGAFISHCGWNSTLESLWCGVPMATWPIYSEQQFNAFELVKELGLAVEIKLDYKKMEENQVIVTAEEIGRAIKQLMEDSESVEIRKKVSAMSRKCRVAVIEGGSSHAAVGQFIEEIINN